MPQAKNLQLLKAGAPSSLIVSVSCSLQPLDANKTKVTSLQASAVRIMGGAFPATSILSCNPPTPLRS